VNHNCAEADALIIDVERGHLAGRRSDIEIDFHHYITRIAPGNVVAWNKCKKIKYHP
jgi:hypothetical protein